MEEIKAEKKEKIKNPYYKKFLKEGIIETLGRDDLDKALNNIDGKYVKQYRSFVIALFYTCARPNEVLKLKTDDFQKEGQYIKIKLQGSKGGLPRSLRYSLKNKHINELYNYAYTCFPNMFLFWNLSSNYIIHVKTKKHGIKDYVERTSKLRYYFRKWFKFLGESGIPPYFLRHNGLSKLAELGATDRDLIQVKGSKTFESIQKYVHMSKERSEKLSNKFNKF